MSSGEQDTKKKKDSGDASENDSIKKHNNGQLEIYLQPKIALDTLACCGAEALIRWKHPTKGMISPELFIPLAEENGCITTIDLFVIETVLKQMEAWCKEERLLLPIAINLSKKCLENENFKESFDALYRHYTIATKYLELEITESGQVENEAQFIKNIKALDEKGFSMALDDFGAAYAFIKMLLKLPIRVIKLDKVIIGEMTINEKAKSIVRGMINIAHEMQVKVVAEGIETEGQLALLQAMKCDMGQGYLFAKPMPIKDYEKWLQMSWKKQ